jgi:hypothetical protein
MTIQIVEHEIYKSILGLTEYEQVYPMPVLQTIKRVANNNNVSLNTDDKSHINTLISNIEKGIQDYFTANPQFKRISKGVVIDMFAYYSLHFKSQYKNVYIERQVSYTAELYLERLIGYFAWLKYTRYDYSDVYDRIVRYNARERKHVSVEANQELNDTINSIYKSYMHLFKNCSNLSKGNVLGILYSVRKQYFPAP